MIMKGSEPFPYITSDADLPLCLRRFISTQDTSQWLVLPDDDAIWEALGSIALRVAGEQLQIVSENPFGGQHYHVISAADCERIQFGNCLLLSEVVLLKGTAELFRFSYSSVGDTLVRQVLQPFSERVCGTANPSIAASLDNPVGPGCSDLMRQFFPAGEACVMVAQPNDAVRKKGGFFKRRSEIIPAVELAISRTRLVVSTKSAGSCSWLCSRQTSVMRLTAIESVQAFSLEDKTVDLRIALTAGGELSVRFDASANPDILAELNTVIEIFTNAAAATKVSAQHELLRLTGVLLPETDALQALAEIHNFKWLEAERAGFDTWAIIQPENPLRAAAVHWVRKHFKKFETAHVHAGSSQQLAS